MSTTRAVDGFAEHPPGAEVVQIVSQARLVKPQEGGTLFQSEFLGFHAYDPQSNKPVSYSLPRRNPPLDILIFPRSASWGSVSSAEDIQVIVQELRWSDSDGSLIGDK